MLEKTKKYLKKEFDANKVTDLKEDFYSAVWAEKAEYTESILLEFICYLETIFNAKDGIKLKKVLTDARHTMDNYRKNPEQKATDNKNQEYNPADSPMLDDGVMISLLKSLLAPKYEPPADNLVGCYAHLQCLDLCYRYLLPATGFYNWATETKLDLALLKLTRHCCCVMQAVELHIKRVPYKNGPGKASREVGQLKVAITSKILERYGGYHGYKALPRGKKKAVTEEIEKAIKAKDSRNVTNIINRIGVLQEKEKGNHN